MFLVGPLGSRQAIKQLLARWAGSSGISWFMLSLVKKAPNHHCASFEPQRVSSFRKRVKDPKLPGEAARTCTPIPLFVKPITLLVVLASSTCGELQLFFIVKLCRPPAHQDWGRAGATGNRFAGDDEKPEPPHHWAKQLPGKRPRETT
jgi:hypothetical protein